MASLIKLLHYVVMLDRSNYARWLPVAIHDLLRLEDMHPELFKFFDDGNFVPPVDVPRLVSKEKRRYPEFPSQYIIHKY